MTAFTMSEAAALALGRIQPARRAVPATAPARSAAPPVRRDSHEAGTFEEDFFAVPAKGETDRLLRTARAALDAGRRARRTARQEGRALTASEAALGLLTAGAVRVYEEICTLARLNAGRVFPSYDHLARATALGRATVARALAALEATGFLVRRRRFKRVAGEGAGPRVAQTSNVYRPTLPGRLLPHLPRWLRPAPPPADVLHGRAERAHAMAAMEATLSARDFALATVEGPLGRMLAKLGAAIDMIERESQTEPETFLHSTKP